jgi:Asp-tRNA(Asn)/Glu-tRNA(Gln) amidotransferase A subunit family amidase
MTIHALDSSTAELPLTVTETAAKFRSGELTSVELTRRMLEQAERLDGRLGSFLARFDETALAAAQQADDDFGGGVDRGPFQGIPVGIKDILAAREGPTTAQSLILARTWGEGKDAPVVSRLREAGAVIMGKTTTMEFATGLPDPTKPFPLPRNPWNLDHWTGGSSSGSGNGVAAGFFLAGIGTDTGGSIRGPSAFCGISGLKPTFGRVPKSGCAPLGYSLDHIGPMARSARDCAAMLSVIAGYDASDECCADRPVDDYLAALTGSLSGVRVGVERAHHFPEEADPALRETFEAAVAVLADLGATLVDVELPYYDELRVASMVTSRAEAMAYHLPDLQTRWDDYFAATRLGLARGALATGADYVQAQRVRRLAKGRLAELFQTVDLVVGPASPTAATSYADLPARMFDMAMRLSFTSYWNAVGQPALVVPMGFNAAGLPLSLQIAGRPFEEATVLSAGDAYQGATTWHLQVAPMVTAAPAEA